MLVINGNLESSGSCRIYVSPKAAAVVPTNQKPSIDRSLIPIKDAPVSSPLPQEDAKEEEKAKEAPSISPGQVESMLWQIVKKEKNADILSEYMCGNTNITVTYNNKNTPFETMISELRSHKLKKIKSLTIISIIKGANNCITSMVITADIKTGLF